MVEFIKKHKLVVSLFAVIFIALAIIGTTAYFSKGFVSDNNIAKAASFDVDVVNAEGKTIGDAQFDLDEELYPGMEPLEVYSFQINKNSTDVPLEYTVQLTPSGDLFPQDGSTPVNLILQKMMDNEWANVDYSGTFKPENDTESYRIIVDWPHHDNDIDFQGKTGNIKLDVIATQVDPEEETEEPEGPPYYTGEVSFKATPNGSTRTTSKKQVNFYLNDDGYKMIEVYMGDEEGVFEEKVGDLRIEEYVENGTTWYRVYTEHEYFASETQMWRTSTVDTSTEGVLYFDKTLEPYLLIESDALYDWFVIN